MQVAKADQTSVHVTVTNHYVLPVDVYAEGPGTRHRLGTVNPETVSRFVVPPAMVVNGLLEFVAEVGSNFPPVRSGQLQLVMGDTVDFEIATHLIGSTARVHKQKLRG